MVRRKFIFVTVAFVVVVLASPWIAHEMSLPAAAEASGHPSNWQAYIALIRNVPHWLLEITIEVVTGILIYPLARWIWGGAVARHDEKFHKGDRHGLVSPPIEVAQPRGPVYTTSPTTTTIRKAKRRWR